MTTSLLPLALFALVSAALGLGLRKDPHVIPSALIDRPMPEFDLPPLHANGVRLRRSDLEGEVALINVFASWCVSCRVEHPTLMKLTKQAAAPIYGVDWKDRPEDGAAWLAAFGDPYLNVGEDQDSRLAIELGVTGAPETYVVDKSGRIRYKQIGPITDEVWRETLQPLIASLERERAP